MESTAPNTVLPSTLLETGLARRGFQFGPSVGSPLSSVGDRVGRHNGNTDSNGAHGEARMRASVFLEGFDASESEVGPTAYASRAPNHLATGKMSPENGAKNSRLGKPGARNRKHGRTLWGKASRNSKKPPSPSPLSSSQQTVGIGVVPTPGVSVARRSSNKPLEFFVLGNSGNGGNGGAGIVDDPEVPTLRVVSVRRANPLFCDSVIELESFDHESNEDNLV